MAAKLKAEAKFEADRRAKLEAVEASKPKKRSAKLKSLSRFRDHPCIKVVVEANQKGKILNT